MNIPIARDATELSADAPATTASLETGFQEALILASPGVIARVSLETKLPTYISPNVERIMGFPPATFLGRQDFWLERVHPADQDTTVAMYAGAIQNGSAISEYRWLHADGTYHWFYHVTTLTRDARSNPDDLVSYTLDITKRKLTEEHLRESEARFRLLFEHSPDGIVLMDPHDATVRWPIVDANAAACRLNGYAREDLIGLSHDLLHVGPHTMTDDVLLALLREKGTIQGISSHRRKDGSVIPLEYAASLVTIGGRELVLGIDRDITQRKQAEAWLRESEARFRALFEHSPDGILLLDPHDPAQRWTIVDVNVAYCRLSGYTREELIGQSHDLLFVAPHTMPDSAFLEWIRREGVAHGQTVHRRKDGCLMTLEYSTTLISLGGRELLLGIDRDITERLATEEALRESETRFRQLADHIHEIFWLTDLGRQQVLYVSPAYEAITGRSPAELYAGHVDHLDVIHPDDRERVRAALPRQLDEPFDEEYRIVRPDNTIRWVRDRSFLVRDEQGDVTRLAGIIADITEKRQAEELLRRQALYDTLTGLPNRVLLHDRLGRSLARLQRRPGYCFAVLFLDLDGFKALNDRLGHSMGDQLLIGVARRLEVCGRAGDTVARLGGDEFVLALDDIDALHDAIAVAERIMQTLASPFMLEGQEFFIGASIGIARSRPEYCRPDDVLRDADAAMYRAKAQGRACIAVFDGPVDPLDDAVSGLAE